MTLNVSNIQHFSVGDGDGIRTTVFLKGCALRCPWCHNPETWSPEPQTLYYPAANKTVHYGQQMTTEEVLEEVLADREFYESSNGGVTISGGEALLQADAVAELAARLKEGNVSVFIDTAADVPFAAFEKTMPYTDTYLVDLKAATAEDYRDVIGGNFERVTDNIRRLLEQGQNMRMRIPLIPQFNTSPTYVEQMKRVLRWLNIQAVDLLPFHRLGSGKYTALEREYAYADIQPFTPQEIADIATQYATDFKVRIEK